MTSTQDNRTTKLNLPPFDAPTMLVEFAPLAVLGLATLACNLVYIPVPLHMLIASMCTIWVGSFGALRTSAKGEGGEPTPQSEEVHHMSRRDVYMSPILGSCLLFGLYLVYKFCPKFYVNLLIKAYFALFGVVSIGEQIASVVRTYCGKKVEWHDRVVLRFKIPFFNTLDAIFGLSDPPSKKEAQDKSESEDDKAGVTEESDPAEVVITGLDGVGLLIGSVIGIWYVVKNHWVANNIFGVAFSLHAIRMLSIGSFFNGVVLLTGLFFYDVFWVFGTDVMVTVAKSFDGPIKLLFPRWVQEAETGKWQSSLLGLGDIVMPGIFIALMLRFDRYRKTDMIAMNGKTDAKAEAEGKKNVTGFYSKYPYFSSTMVGYFVGLSMTIAVMNVFNAAQPALLYLVPTCVGSSLIQSMVLGELQELWNYEENSEEEAEKDAKKND